MDYLLLKQINGLGYRWPILDRFGIFCADWLIFVIPLIIVVAYYFSSKRKQIGLIILQAICALGLVYLMSYLLGQIWPRLRPFATNHEIHQLTQILVSSTEQSFPSDHTAISFIMAGVVLFSWRKLGIVLLFLAALVGLARIFVGVHWPSDILAGIIVAAIAVLLTKIIFKIVVKLVFSPAKRGWPRTKRR